MRSVVATVGNWVLGHRLRSMRVTAGLTARAVAAELECSAALISRIEHGERGIKPDTLSHLVLITYGRSEAELAEMERQRVDAKHGHWWMELGSEIPWHMSAYLEIEEIATSVLVAGIDVIPGLIQTEEYAHAQLSLMGDLSEEQIRDRVRIRMRRQSRLSGQDPLELSVLLTEGAFRRAAAHPGQIDYLAELAADDHISIRVLPTSLGPHPVTSMYTVLSPSVSAMDPVLHVEHSGDGVFVQDPETVRRVMINHKRLGALAIDVRECTKGAEWTS